MSAIGSYIHYHSINYIRYGITINRPHTGYQSQKSRIQGQIRRQVTTAAHDANIREVHAGHLHHEAEADIYGVMVRRLSSGGIVDDWTNRQDFVGSHRRFMLFEWDLERLRSIHYI